MVYFAILKDKIKFGMWLSLVERLLWEREQDTPFLKSKSAKKPLFMRVFGTLQNLKIA